MHASEIDLIATANESIQVTRYGKGYYRYSGSVHLDHLRPMVYMQVQFAFDQPRMTIAFSPVVRVLPDRSTWSSPKQSSGANLCS
jgi:hypothetical protein